MKVLEQTSNRLKLQHVPWRNWFWGVMLALSGSFGLIYLIGFNLMSAQLQCDRPSPTQMVCTLEQYAPIRRVQTLRLLDIQRAELITRQGGKGGPRYEIGLLTSAGETIFLPGSGASYEKTESIAGRINQYLNDSSQGRLILQQNEVTPTFGLACLTLVLLGSGVWLISTPKITCAFYKRVDQVMIEYHSWRGVYKTVKYPLHLVICVDIEEQRTKYGKVFRPQLILASGQRQRLSRNFTSEQPVRAVSFAIEQFLAQRD